MKRIILQLDETTVNEVDEAVREGSSSRSAFLREAVEAALGERRRRHELREVVRSFEAKPQDAPRVSRAGARRAWPS